MLMQNTRESAIRREEFHRILQTWLDESLEDRVGDVSSHAGPAWLWVRHGGKHFFLDADSTRAGVRSYLRIVEECGGDPDWSMQRTDDDSRERVAIGPDGHILEGFEFYHHLNTR